MIKFLLSFFCLGLAFGSTPSTTFAQEVPFYSTLTEEQEIAITEKYEVIRTRRLDLLIHSIEGMEHASTVLFYDKLNEILDFELELIHPLTEKSLSKARIKDMTDFAYYSSSTIFDDNRYKAYTPKSATFPVRVKILTQTKAKTNFNLPTWIPVPQYNQKVSQSTLKISYPKSFGLRYKEKNLSGTRMETVEAGVETITWLEKDLPIQERDMKKEDDHRLILAPAKFAMGGFSGEMNDWNGLAKWNYELNRGRNKLPNSFQKELQAMVADLEDPYDKIKVLYSYLQNNYRYVSIQLGIGGWQTMTAEEAIKYSYGDCKALTNLMQGMLEVVGIPAYYTLVYAGVEAEDIETDLPSNQFNHVILQVPLPSSPVWLECTSNLLPAGFLGDFTSNRHVLVVTPDGGYLTKTPTYDTHLWNTIRTKSTLKLEENGDAYLSTTQNSQGNPAEGLLSLKNYSDTREQRDFFNKNSSVSGLIIKDLDLKVSSRDSLLFAEVQYDGFIQKFSQNTARRVIIKPFLQQIKPQMLNNNALAMSEEYSIELPYEVGDASEFENMDITEDQFQLKLTHRVEGKTLIVQREMMLTLPQDSDDSMKEELVKKVNSLSTKSYFFTKPTLSTYEE
ncbi:transglutaminase-like domain-containing protein [Algoriphagus namhaensis]